MKDIAIVFDCGATNVRVIAMDAKGQILASKAAPNETSTDPFYENGIIWDVDQIWGKLCVAAKHVVSQIDASRIAGITVTTFGVDGTFVDADGKLLYPVISWKCERTQPIMNTIEKYMPLEDVYAETGVFPYAFNTINKMIWFKENRPDILEQAHQYLFIPSLFINKLCGAFKNDTTMVGTSMMGDLANSKLSSPIFDAIGISSELWGDISKPGDVAGHTNASGQEATDLPVGIPVYLCGHDTQFAIFGSGADLNQPVLSSGTWEILMARTSAFSSTPKELALNLTTEMDAIPGVFNIGQNWLGSGVLEWFSKNFYPELKGDKLYETMIAEASLIDDKKHGLFIDAAFYKDNIEDRGGVIEGITLATTRADIYRALLESLAERLNVALEALQTAGQFKADRILCVGGGSKNKLWNQLRADACGVPIHIIDKKETTVLGAALFVFYGAGLFSSVEAARDNIDYNKEVFYPQKR